MSPLTTPPREPGTVVRPEPVGGGRARTVAAWATALVAAASVGGVYLLAVLTPTGQHVDDRLMTWAATTVEDTGWAARLLGEVGQVPLLLLVTGAVAALAGAVHGPWRAVVVAAVAATTVVVSQVLKAGLERPSLLDATMMNSFPSGHVAAVAGVAAALVLAVPRVLRAPTLLVTLPVVGAVGLATVVLAWHRPSDVVASVLIAVACAGLGEALVPSRRRPARTAPAL
ncbi:phosphatase PAP2 family protein [Nocardioides sp. HDW12B]|uniref:phosphatase PAP2 family protein n=1 Tax=Nocardioides sp. HDW12B TaxID=2714939 RepID=UPI00140BC45A|nr:phosphatase PAP2 family protein [Nocardioides sp. HDW12B]QIK67469.1 phosphatase PAP2 family protein [Nocardioides sp. HDW12B]